MPLSPRPPRLYRSGTTDGDCSLSCQVGQIDRGLLWDFWQLGHRVCPFSPHTFPPGSCWPRAVPHLVPPCPLAAALGTGSRGRAGLGWWQPCFAVMAPFTSSPGAIPGQPAAPRAGPGLSCLRNAFYFTRAQIQGNSPLPFFPLRPSVLLSCLHRHGTPGMVTQSDFPRASPGSGAVLASAVL